MPRIRMTERTLQSLRAETDQQAFWDQSLPRFGVRVSLGGRKTFCIRYRVNGKRRRMSLGHFPYIKLGEARDRAKELFGQIARGIDPQGSPSPGLPSPSSQTCTSSSTPSGRSVPGPRTSE